MDTEYFIEGYTLMNEYMKQERIKTRERKFRRKLDKFYEKHKHQEYLNPVEEKEYLLLEQYFYNNIAKPTNSTEKGLCETLNILSNIDYTADDTHDD